MTMENLPDEVLSDIFIRLLSKQLAQMRCVCKPWNALLSESSFIESHLHRSIHNNDEIFLLFSHGSSLIKARPTCSPDLELTSFIKFPVNPKSEMSSGSVIGSVNGLICFSYTSYCSRSFDYVVHIWNPSLSAVLTLPPCSLPSDDLKEYHFRFGFDPKTDDYKVVKLTSHPRPANMLPQVEVYSMRKGSWELTAQKFPSHITKITDDDNVCVDGHDGHIHWLGSTGLEWKPQMIVGFDLGAETFHEIPLPDSLLHRHVYYFDVLGVLGGKLCVISWVRRGKWEVWVMDEHGVSESWVKHHAFSLFGGDVCPYGFTSQNEFLFQLDGRVYLYDPKATRTETFKMPGGGLGKYKIMKYVDSLVWVAPAEHKLSKRHLLISILKSHRLLIKGLQKPTKGFSRFLLRRGICF